MLVCGPRGTELWPPLMNISMCADTAPFSAVPKRANGTPNTVSTPPEPSSTMSAMPSLP